MFQCSQIFSIFIYNESLPIKSYQFLKIYKRFEKKKKEKKKKYSCSRQWEKKNWEKLNFVLQQVVL